MWPLHVEEYGVDWCYLDVFMLKILLINIRSSQWNAEISLDFIESYLFCCKTMNKRMYNNWVYTKLRSNIIHETSSPRIVITVGAECFCMLYIYMCVCRSVKFVYLYIFVIVSALRISFWSFENIEVHSGNSNKWMVNGRKPFRRVKNKEKKPIDPMMTRAAANAVYIRYQCFSHSIYCFNFRESILKYFSLHIPLVVYVGVVSQLYMKSQRKHIHFSLHHITFRVGASVFVSK